MVRRLGLLKLNISTFYRKAQSPESHAQDLLCDDFGRLSYFSTRDKGEIRRSHVTSVDVDPKSTSDFRLCLLQITTHFEDYLAYIRYSRAPGRLSVAVPIFV
jgi:hypothetical protein